MQNEAMNAIYTEVLMLRTDATHETNMLTKCNDHTVPLL